jgi:hypothetical protein
MAILTHPLRYAALVVVTAGACSLSVVAIAQAGTAGKPAVHKRHLQHESYFGHLTGPAAAWVSGQCDRPLQSELPPCIYWAWPAPYHYTVWPYYRTGWRPAPTLNDE